MKEPPTKKAQGGWRSKAKWIACTISNAG